MKNLPVDVKLLAQVSPESVAALKPDVIVVATGARRQAPAIPGANQKHVWSGDELRRLMTGDRADEVAKAKLNLSQRAMFKAGGILKVTDSTEALQSLSKLWMPLGKKVVIVGGGLVGLELAEFLLARGREVTVLEPTDKAGRELSIVRRWRVLTLSKRMVIYNSKRRCRKSLRPMWCGKIYKAKNIKQLPTRWCWQLALKRTTRWHCNWPNAACLCIALEIVRVSTTSKAPCTKDIEQDAVCSLFVKNLEPPRHHRHPKFFL